MSGIQAHRRTLPLLLFGTAPPTPAPEARQARQPSNGALLLPQQQFTFTLSPDAAQNGHEYTLNGGSDWFLLTWSAVEYNYQNYPANTVGVRVATTSQLLASNVLWAEPITKIAFPADNFNPQTPAWMFKNSYDSAEGLNGAVGWVILAEHPEFKVQVDVYISHPVSNNNFVCVARVEAKIYGGGIASYNGYSDDRYNYSRINFIIPHKFRDSQAGTIVYHVANRPNQDIPIGGGGKVFTFYS